MNEYPGNEKYGFLCSHFQFLSKIRLSWIIINYVSILGTKYRMKLRSNDNNFIECRIKFLIVP